MRDVQDVAHQRIKKKLNKHTKNSKWVEVGREIAFKLINQFHSVLFFIIIISIRKRWCIQ